MPKAEIRNVGFIVGLVILLLFFYVYQRIQILRLGYKIKSIEKQIASLQKDNSFLKLETLKLVSPEHIAAEVKRLNLGLEPPKEKQIIRTGAVKSK